MRRDLSSGPRAQGTPGIAIYGLGDKGHMAVGEQNLCPTGVIAAEAEFLLVDEHIGHFDRVYGHAGGPHRLGDFVGMASALPEVVRRNGSRV